MSTRLYVNRRSEEDDGLVIHNVQSTSAIAPISSQNVLNSEPSIKPMKDAHAKSNPQTATNAAIIALSVISSIAMVIVLSWYLRLKRQEQLARLRLGSDRSSSRHTRSGGGSGGGSGSGSGSGTRYVQPLKTSFIPSFKSSFGFTGASPDSPWSRTEVNCQLYCSGADGQGTITPLSRAAGQEFMYSPGAESGATLSPESARATRPPSSAILSPPPVTAHTQRTFRTSIHSMMVNRDVRHYQQQLPLTDIQSTTTHNPSLAEDFFPNSKRPRTRLPSYHTDYAKSSPYSAEIKKGFIPGPVPLSDTSSPSKYTFMGHGTDIPPVPLISKLSQLPPSPPPSSFKTKPLRVPKPPRAPALVLAPINTRQSLKEYLDSSDVASSSASHRARVNSVSTRQSISSSSHHVLSDDWRGLMFLAPSVVVDDRRKVSIPADPDSSPTQGWAKLPESSRRLA